MQEEKKKHSNTNEFHHLQQRHLVEYKERQTILRGELNNYCEHFVMVSRTLVFQEYTEIFKYHEQ